MRVSLFFLFCFCRLFAFGVQVSIEPKTEGISAGEHFVIDVNFKIPEGSYIYCHTPGEMGLPTTLAWTLPDGWHLINETWPEPKQTIEEGFKIFTYKNDFTMRSTFAAASELHDGKAAIGLKAEWLKCEKNTCEPGEKDFFIKIPTFESVSAAGNTQSLLFVFLGAFIGGMILNLMPCVFPVIGLKILSFANDAADSRKTALKNALLYSLGIVVSFIALAAVLAWLKSIGNELGWGFQLQNPIFVAALIFLFFAMGLSFAGLFAIGTGFAALDSKFQNKGAAAFVSGIIAVLVASPCTAPLMGASLGVALASGTETSILFSIFAILGIGMAFPYVLLSAVPQFAKILPKPGPWMNTFKQFMAFPLFATAVWLLWIFSQQAGTDNTASLLFALLLFSFALWGFGKWSIPSKPKKTRMFSNLIFVFLAAASFLWAAGSASYKEGEKLHNAWSDAKVEELRGEGKMVYVDFTASWCLTCVANKKAVLETAATKKLFDENNIVLLRADWTNKDPSITRKLEEFGRSGVPLNILYPADTSKAPVILPEILTRNALIEAIDKARQ